MTLAKCIVFENPPPTYVFQHATFQTRIKVVYSTPTITSTPVLQFTLRYHDTYDVVPDQSIMKIDATSTAVDAVSNVCALRLALNQLTTSYEGRPFCIEVRSMENDIESVFSTPIYVVKEKLRITEQPPDVWFKDEGGREKCMVISAVMEAAPGFPLEDRVVPLQLTLLYESGTPVVNQSILRLFPDMRPNMTHGRVSISFRIDDVSKNHQGQSFVLQIGPEKQSNSLMFQDIAPVQTSVIAIRSKRNKRKLSGCTPRNASPHAMMKNSPVAQRPRHLTPPYVPTPQSTSTMMPTAVGSGTWSSHIQSQPPTPQQTQRSPAPMTSPAATTMEWKLAAFEIHPDGSANVSRPIYRCNHCRRLADSEMMAGGHQRQDLHGPQCVYNPQAFQYYTTPRATQTSQLFVTTKQEPAALAAPTTHRPVLTISPYMSKTTTDETTDGNLFASTAFRSHMGLLDLAVDEKLDLLEKEESLKELSVDNSSSSTFMASATNPLFPEMDSLLQGKSLDDFQTMGVTSLGGNGNGEDQVFYIHACMYTSNNGQKLGLPTFDQFQQMVGFYWESQTDAQTQVVFRSLSDIIGFTTVEQVAITAQFQEALRQDSDAVHSLPKYQHNLVQLREDALMYYWSQSIQCLA